MAAGMDDYIPKPVRIGELQAALERWGKRILKRSDTAFFSQQGITGNLLDQAIIEELRSMPADNTTMLQELIGLFLDGAPQRISQIHQFLADPHKLGFHAHALKSMSLNLGANRIAELCQKLEEMAHSGDEESASRVAQELDRTFRRTQAELITLRAQE